MRCVQTAVLQADITIRTIEFPKQDRAIEFFYHAVKELVTNEVIYRITTRSHISTNCVEHMCGWRFAVLDAGGMHKAKENTQQNEMCCYTENQTQLFYKHKQHAA